MHFRSFLRKSCASAQSGISPTVGKCAHVMRTAGASCGFNDLAARSVCCFGIFRW